LDSTDTFEIELTVSIGVVLVHVSTDPESVAFTPTWSMQQDVGDGKLVISKDDPRFHIATWYYVSLQSLLGSSISYIRVNQRREVSFLANGYGQKFQFISENELVKYMVFEVPKTWSKDFFTVIEVESLGENCYPSLYLRKNEREDIPDNWEELAYPTLVKNFYDLKFGDNFSYQLYNKRAVYEFFGKTSLAYTYYTVAVYSNCYGMTDMRKPDFKLTVTSVEIENPSKKKNSKDDKKLLEPHEEEWLQL